MDYSLLKNKVYLYLLAFYNNKKKPSYSEISQNIDICRQTVSKKMQELINNGIVVITEDDNIQVDNVLQIDVNELKKLLEQRIYNPTKIAQLLLLKDENLTNDKLAETCGVSRASFYNNQHANGTFIYGIVSEGQLKYIGSTDNMVERIKQHIKNRPFLKPDNFIILKQIFSTGRYSDEIELIHILQPEWNKMGCQ